MGNQVIDIDFAFVPINDLQHRFASSSTKLNLSNAPGELERAGADFLTSSNTDNHTDAPTFVAA